MLNTIAGLGNKIIIDNLEVFVRDNSWDDTILKHELIDNVYDIKNPLVVVDIGAHIGGTTMYCASRGAKVYAYEPSLINYIQLVKHVEANKLETVKHYNLAIGDGKKRKLYHHSTNYGCFSFDPTNVKDMMSEYEEVETITIQDVFKNIDHCDLLKIDCEGAEEEWYQDIPVEKIDQISMEIHNYNTKIKKWLEQFYNVNQFNEILICQKKH